MLAGLVAQADKNISEHVKTIETIFFIVITSKYFFKLILFYLENNESFIKYKKQIN